MVKLSTATALPPLNEESDVPAAPPPVPMTKAKRVKMNTEPARLYAATDLPPVNKEGDVPAPSVLKTKASKRVKMNTDPTRGLPTTKSLRFGGIKKMLSHLSFRTKKNDPPTTIEEEMKATTFTPVDMDLLRSLEIGYSAAANLTDVHDRARRVWTRRAAWCSFLFMMVYFTVGVIFFRSQTDWSLLDTMLFIVYTTTSAGGGQVTIPHTVLIHVFDMFYILVGIAAMAITVAQLFMFIDLEATRINAKRKAAELARQGNSENTRAQDAEEVCWGVFDRLTPFFAETTFGRFLSVFLPLALLLLSGALTIGLIEGWTFIESIYFGIVSMTTVGYGDYVPHSNVGKIIALLWLPFNVVFTSIYMGVIAAWYLNVSALGTQSIRDGLESQAARKAAIDRSVDIEDGLNDDEVFLGDAGNASDKDRLAAKAGNDEDGMLPAELLANTTLTLTTTQDVIHAVRKYTEEGDLRGLVGDGDDTESSRFMALTSNDESKPTFALRVLVQERLAFIIAREIAGGRHTVDVQETFIIVRIGKWKEVTEKWCIPSGAFKAFRAAALGAMMLVGEHSLVRHGAAALYRLSPDEFHTVFSPLVAAMGAAETLDGWLNSTEELARKYLVDGNLTYENLEPKQHRTLTVEESIAEFPKSTATAFH